MRIERIVFALALAMISAGVAVAQDKNADSTAKTPTVPLKVQVNISRYEGDKKISVAPYTLSVNAGRTASLRMGSKVPVTSSSLVAAGEGKRTESYQYTDVGTSIDCLTGALDDGRFRVEVIIDDSSVEEQSRATSGDRPSFRSFRASNSLVLKDGQTAQFTSAVDKTTGVVTKVDVSLTVVK
jgi:hypothetical protein